LKNWQIKKTIKINKSKTRLYCKLKYTHHHFDLFQIIPIPHLFSKLNRFMYISRIGLIKRTCL